MREVRYSREGGGGGPPTSWPSQGQERDWRWATALWEAGPAQGPLPLLSHTPEGGWSGAHREIAALPLLPRGSQLVLN